MKRRAEDFEGTDILDLLTRILNGEDDLGDCNELTKGRIRTIYARVKYGKEDPREVARYYSLPPDLIRDIADNRVFRDITSGTQ